MAYNAVGQLKTSFAIGIILGLALNIGFAIVDRDGWGIDYNQFYSAGKLAGTGHLYDWQALRKVELERGLPMPTGRLPVVAYGHKLLASLPYRTAHWIWLALNLVALGVFALVWPEADRRWMVLALVWSMPATLLLLYGQDTPIWLMSCAAGLFLMKRERPWSAGAAFSLCICKFHLALGIPVMLVAQKRWKTLIAGAVAGAVWLAVSFLIEGPNWVSGGLGMSRLPEFSPAANHMPTLFGLSVRLPWSTAVEIMAAVVVAALLWRFSRQTTGLGMAGAAAAASGLLLARHAYANDAALLIPLLVFSIQRVQTPAWLRSWALVLLSPVPVVLLASAGAAAGQLLILAFVPIALVVLAAGRTGRAVEAAGEEFPKTDSARIGSL